MQYFFETVSNTRKICKENSVVIRLHTFPQSAGLNVENNKYCFKAHGSVCWVFFPPLNFNQHLAMSLRAEILGGRGHPGVLPGLPPAHHTTG